MKNRLFNAFLLLAMVGLMFTACKKEYPEPPIQDLPIGTVYTIDQILAMESGTVFNEDASVYGIVTADEQSGNLYKAAFMQDRATGAALELHLNAVSGVRIGDSIRVYLKDVTYSLYNNLPQLTDFEADGHIIILANNKPIEPTLTTIANINAGQHLAGLVRLENVRFTEQNTFAEPSTYGNRTLADPTDYSQTVIVRTSNYANFANDSLPQGTGNLTAIAAVYGNTWQLYIRSAKELEFEGYVPGGDADLPYYQDFASSFGTYTTYDVLGPQSWEIDYNTAKMTGYVNNTNNENDDWLISRKFSLENVSSASMTITYIARYFANVNEDITVWVSSDYTSGDPTSQSVHWDSVSVVWTEGTNWTDFISTTLDLSNFVGQKVCVAVRYKSNNVKAGTIEVQSILIQEGSGPTPPGPGTGGEVQTMPYCQDFANDFGTYMAYDIMGDQKWEIDYSTAKMTGYVGGSYYANEDWLISSPVAITGVTDAKMTMSYIGRYFNNINEEVTIWASTDYTWGDSPTRASWLPVSASLSESNSWSNFITSEISLTQFVDKTVTFAVKYTSTDSKAGTMEIQSICIEEGSAGGGGGGGGGGGTGEGSGTATDPYNVAAGIGLQSEEPIAWVHGYIVGAVKSGLSTVTGNSDINWSAPFDLATNVVIADDVTCREISQCIIVNLPAGKPLRTLVNLMDNPDNLGKHLAVNGKLRKYFGQAGLRDSNGTNEDFVLEGVTPPSPGTEIFSESFATGQGAFTIQDVVLPSELTYIWQYASNYSCMKASAFVGQAYAAESWLISPAIDLSGVSSAKLSFSQAINYASPNGVLSVMISTNYNDNVTTATWTELSLDQWPAGNNWTFITSTADLTPYIGQTVNIAFKYTSTTSASATWEVKDFVVEE